MNAFGYISLMNMTFQDFCSISGQNWQHSCPLTFEINSHGLLCYDNVVSYIQKDGILAIQHTMNACDYIWLIKHDFLGFLLYFSPKLATLPFLTLDLDFCQNGWIWIDEFYTLAMCCIYMICGNFLWSSGSAWRCHTIQPTMNAFIFLHIS